MPSPPSTNGRDRGVEVEEVVAGEEGGEEARAMWHEASRDKSAKSGPVCVCMCVYGYV